MKALLDLWSRAVISAEGEACRAEGYGKMRCGGPLQAHHVYGKGAYPSMKYHLNNGIPACRNHHLYWIEAQPPMVLLPWLVSQLGHERLEALGAESALRSKMSKSQLSEIMEAEKLLLTKGVA